MKRGSKKEKIIWNGLEDRLDIPHRKWGKEVERLGCLGGST